MTGQTPTPGKQVVKNFFTALFSGKPSKAESTLKRIQKRYKLGENDPYYKALYGIYYAYISDDRDAFIFNLWNKYLGGEKKKNFKNEFKDLLEKAYDPPERFIRAWLDLIDLLDSLPKPHKLKKSS
ncbi:MAG: hypothetical protein J7J94_04860 [Thaumarchaeota archaeon]|nr:hypothetical protein [Nitrososphaerota archaeon]